MITLCVLQLVSTLLVEVKLFEVSPVGWNVVKQTVLACFVGQEVEIQKGDDG